MTALPKAAKRLRRFTRALADPRHIGNLAVSDSAIKRHETLASRLNAEEIAARRTLCNRVPDDGVRIDPEKGFLCLTLPAGDPIFAPARRLALTMIEDAADWDARKGNSGFITRRNLDPRDRDHAPVFEFAADARFLGPITHYFQMVPIFEKAVLWYAPRDRVMDGGSQLLHRDANARSQIKLFVYLEDVTPESGPLHVLPATHSEALYNRLAREPGGAAIRRDRSAKIPDTRYEGLAERDAVAPVTGPAGTCLMADTSRCYHFGSRPGSDTRKVLMMKYVLPTARNLPLWGRQPSGPPEHLADGPGIPEAVRRALFAYV